MMPSDEVGRFPRADLERMRPALEEALRYRPDWAEGHLRLGMALVGFYEHDTARSLREAKADAATVLLASNPIWLHGKIHSATAEQMAELGDILAEEPVRRYLVPAARCFLQARRCSPDLALSHARLGSLDYLLDRGEPASVHAERALRLTGYDSRVLDLAGIVAADVDARDLAARCWRKSLSIHPQGWPKIAQSAAAILTPEQIAGQVLASQERLAVDFADLLYAADDKAEARGRLLRAALGRLSDDPTLAASEADRLWVEAQIRARLGERDQAHKQMAEALELEPLKDEWRQEFVAWLIEWGDLREAQEQARVGVHLNPGHEGLQKMMKAAAEAFARGAEPPPDAAGPGTTATPSPGPRAR